MQNFIKKLLGRKDPEPIVIPFDTLPVWLSEREKSARTQLISRTEDPVKKIRDAMANLQNIVNTIAKTEHDPEIHPKLKSIAKNSLPLFVKAMNSSLVRELPEDIENFYPAAVESLKSCLNSTQGQGRYLQIVFPEEMKTVRTGIDTIGREINEITAVLTDYRKEKTLVDNILNFYNAFVDINIDMGKAADKDQRIIARIKEISERIAAIEKEEQSFPVDEGMAEAARLESALKETETRRDIMARTYAALSMTASHVFRKAEKIAIKQKHPAEISILRHTMELLSDHEIPESKELHDTLAVACPVVERMIVSGEIQLKNKEERAIFSDTRQFSLDICGSCTDLITGNETCRIALEKLASHPLRVRAKSLEREKSQLEIMLKKEQHARTELEEWKNKTNERVPALRDELQKNVEKLAGGSVQIRFDS
jgi:hypothetical protein